MAKKQTSKDIVAVNLGEAIDKSGIGRNAIAGVAGVSRWLDRMAAAGVEGVAVALSGPGGAGAAPRLAARIALPSNAFRPRGIRARVGK